MRGIIKSLFKDNSGFLTLTIERYSLPVIKIHRPVIEGVSARDHFKDYVSWYEEKVYSSYKQPLYINEDSLYLRVKWEDVHDFYITSYGAIIYK